MFKAKLWWTQGVLKRFEVGLPGSGNQLPLPWGEGLAQPAGLAPAHTQPASHLLTPNLPHACSRPICLPFSSSGWRLHFHTPEPWRAEKPRSWSVGLGRARQS